VIRYQPICTVLAKQDYVVSSTTAANSFCLTSGFIEESAWPTGPSAVETRVRLWGNDYLQPGKAQFIIA
jgi:hypothetical protein